MTVDPFASALPPGMVLVPPYVAPPWVDGGRAFDEYVRTHPLPAADPASPPFTRDQTTLRQELTALLNRHSVEQFSDTPDHVLAQYLIASLRAYESAVQARTALAAYDNGGHLPSGGGITVNMTGQSVPVTPAQGDPGQP
ncbi:MAG: hypothetical protein EPO06_11720 [Burkholderiaceae bacterium]|nr:MAG: hypothetical protein EPO06_11720 [Burkholderiaceae bacterium]